MTLEELKRSFFGYRKADVYQYIAYIEQSFSEKLMQKDQQLEKIESQYQEKISRMEAELATLRKECERHQNEQTSISAVLLKAQHYAEALKKQTEEKEKQARHHLEKELKIRQQEIDRYHAQIRSVREMLSTLLSGMDEAAEKLENHVEHVLADSPSGNMSLFRHKAEMSSDEEQSGRK